MAPDPPDGLDRSVAEARDAADPLAPFRDSFAIPEPDVIYLDGNSLGRPLRASMDAVASAVTGDWATGLVRSWEHWVDLPTRLGDRLAGAVLGAGPGEVVVADSTSVNLYKLAAAVLDASPERGTVVVDADDFPTDRYLVQGLARERGRRVVELSGDIDMGLRLDQLRSAMTEDVALVVLSLVSYRSGALLDMAEVNAIAGAAGARVLWDLSHAAGAVPIDLSGSGAELAVGCTYKYLNGGPGAPAFAYLARHLQGALRQPIQGWFGQRDQFGMGPAYDPVPTVEQLLVGTPPILSMVALEPSIAVIAEAGLPVLRAKTLRQTELAAELVREWLVPLGFRFASPPDAARRGAHVTLEHPDAWRICRALAERAKVVTDFRVPDRIRFGFPPLYTRYVDVWDALAATHRTVTEGWHETTATARARVT